MLEPRDFDGVLNHAYRQSKIGYRQKEVKPMPKRILPLTDLQVQKAKAKEKEYKLSDGGGLYLLVTPTGGKLWRFDYRFNDKRKTLSFKTYPEISLSQARINREEARKLVANGVDPSEFKKEQAYKRELESQNTFELVTRKWFDTHKGRWSEGHSKHILSRFENDIFPVVGNKPLVDVRRRDLTKILEAVSKRALETAHRMKIAINQMLNYAVAHEYIPQNPLGDTRGLLPKIVHKHMAAPTDPKEVGPLLRALDGFSGSGIVRAAMQLAPMLFCRPGELRHMEWTEVNFETAEWNIPAAKMKMRQAHLVPLSKQAVDILKELHLLTGHGRYAFPCHRTPQKCMSDNAINAALRRLGFEKDEITNHGFRAMARTMLDEILGFRPDIIEHQLAHAVRDPLGRAYNRTTHLVERKKMMQTWADYLDGLKAGAKVIPLRQYA
jgi:integrase